MRTKSLIGAAVIAAALFASGCSAGTETRIDLLDGSKPTNTDGVTYHRVEYVNDDGDTRVLDCLYFRGTYGGGPWCEHVGK